MRTNETIPSPQPRLPRSEHPSRERSDHANLDRPEAHPGSRAGAPRPVPRRADAPPGREGRH